MFETKSNVIHARPGSSSLRTTLPKEVITTLKLKNGDVLNWNAETKNDILILTIEKE